MATSNVSGGRKCFWDSPHQDHTNTLYIYPTGFRETVGSLLILENLVGFVFNVTVLVVHLIKKDGMKSVSSAFLINLNVVDLLVCAMTIPMTTARVFTGLNQTPMFCVFHEATVSVATTSTALGLMIISIDRYQTIVTPFKRRLNMKNMPGVLGLMWALVVFGFLFPIIALLPSSTDNKLHEEVSNTSNDSTLTMSCFSWARHDSARIVYEFYYIVIYVIANTVMIVCYASIYIAAKRRINTRMSIIRAAVANLPGVPKLNINAQKLHERTITKMTLMIVMTFVVCWAPHVVVSVIMVTCDTQYMELVQIVCLALAYSATLLHPLLYAFMQKNFREAFNKKIVHRTTPRRDPSRDGQKPREAHNMSGLFNNKGNKVNVVKSSQPQNTEKLDIDENHSKT